MQKKFLVLLYENKKDVNTYMLWLEKERSYNSEQLRIIENVTGKYNTDSFISSLIAERNDFNLDEIDYYLSKSFKPVSPFGLKDMDKAVDLILEHMNKKSLILGVTDYDL